jgi:hypothetical protein
MKKRVPSSLTQMATQALTEAVAKAVENHRRQGIPLAVWQDGKAVSKPPGKVMVLHETPAAYRAKARGRKP